MLAKVIFVLCISYCIGSEILPRTKFSQNETEYHLYHRSDFTFSDQIKINDEESIRNSRFNGSLPTVFLIHGWSHGRKTPWMVEMREAMAIQSQWNVIVVDWSHISNNLYFEARMGLIMVGKHVAELILFLIRIGATNTYLLHLIGHSMGAQIAGMAARKIQNVLDKKVARITGLDPAAPLFEWPLIFDDGDVLNPLDAEFVDVIHTNGFGLGVINPCGHVDFYPNGGVHQPGCQTIICSHMRAVEFWTASIKNPYLFKAYSTDNWNQYLTENRKDLPYVLMGIAADSSIPRGIYFLETVAEVPYLHSVTTLSDSFFS